MLTNLQKPIKIKNVTIKNRFVVPSLRMNYCTKEGFLTDTYIGFIKARAKGGFGLIIANDYAIGSNCKTDYYSPSLDSDDFIPSNETLTKSVHEFKSTIFAELNQPGAFAFGCYSEKSCVVPSLIIEGNPQKQVVLAINEIKEIESQFALAAFRAKKAGFDGIIINAASGFLLANFLSPFFNQRNDKYGGSNSNRLRIIKETYQQVVSLVGKDIPIGIKISAYEEKPVGRTLDDTISLVKQLEKIGFDFIIAIPPFNDASIALGYFQTKATTIPSNEPFKALKAAIHIPLIITNQIYKAEIGDKLIEDKYCDMVSFGRACLADPNFAKKSLNHQEKKINYCVHCVSGCSNSLLMSGATQCLINPLLGKESYIEHYKIKMKPKKIGIIGTGMAAMFTTLFLSHLKQQVTIYHENFNIGNLEGTYGENAKEYLNFFNNIKLALTNNHVNMELNHYPTAQEIINHNYDQVVIGYGAKNIVPKIPGINLRMVRMADEFLRLKTDPGENNLIIGNGCQGCETAAILANLKKKAVLVGENSIILDDLPGLPNPTFVNFLERVGVSIYNSSKVLSIHNGFAIIKTPEGQIEIKCDRVYLACGYNDVPQIVKELTDLGYPSQKITIIHKKGNANLSAIEGYRATTEVLTALKNEETKKRKSK
ncbi:MAG: FAD-dependent oxidoreductase [Bacilli bacterium]